MSTSLMQGDHTTALAAESLLREQPDALVCGLSTSGLIMPIPGGVALSGQVASEGRAVPDVAMYESKDQGHGLPVLERAAA
jgi:hypothetical protein